MLLRFNMDRPHEIGVHDGRVLWRREDCAFFSSLNMSVSPPIARIGSFSAASRVQTMCSRASLLAGMGHRKVIAVVHRVEKMHRVDDAKAWRLLVLVLAGSHGRVSEWKARPKASPGSAPRWTT